MVFTFIFQGGKETTPGAERESTENRVDNNESLVFPSVYPPAVLNTFGHFPISRLVSQACRVLLKIVQHSCSTEDCSSPPREGDLPELVKAIPSVTETIVALSHIHILARSDQGECVSAGVENFPCGNEGYNPISPTDRTTSCCLPTFDRDYRPIVGFEAFLSTSYATTHLGKCPLPLNIAPSSNWLPGEDYVGMK